MQKPQAPPRLPPGLPESVFFRGGPGEKIFFRLRPLPVLPCRFRFSQSGRARERAARRAQQQSKRTRSGAGHSSFCGGSGRGAIRRIFAYIGRRARSGPGSRQIRVRGVFRKHGVYRYIFINGRIARKHGSRAVLLRVPLFELISVFHRICRHGLVLEGIGGNRLSPFHADDGQNFIADFESNPPIGRFRRFEEPEGRACLTVAFFCAMQQLPQA